MTFHLPQIHSNSRPRKIQRMDKNSSRAPCQPSIQNTNEQIIGLLLLSCTFQTKQTVEVVLKSKTQCLRGKVSDHIYQVTSPHPEDPIFADGPFRTVEDPFISNLDLSILSFRLHEELDAFNWGYSAFGDYSCYSSNCEVTYEMLPPFLLQICVLSLGQL